MSPHDKCAGCMREAGGAVEGDSIDVELFVVHGTDWGRGERAMQTVWPEAFSCTCT